MNKAIIIGNLGADPEMRSTSGGNSVTNLSVATSRKWKDQNEELKEETEWHRVTVWGKQAESCNKYLSKGKKVAIEGRIQTRSWEDKDGNKRYTTEIIAQNVQFLSGRNEDGGGNTGRSDGPPPPGDDSLPF